MLGEEITVWIVAALVLVSAGIVLINWKPKVTSPYDPSEG